MPATWHVTNLSTTPPNHQMADTDRHALPFTANITVQSVTATLKVLDTLVAYPAGIESATVNGTNTGAIVVIENLARGTTYELRVTMTAADGTTETGVLVIECVA